MNDRGENRFRDLDVDASNLPPVNSSDSANPYVSPFASGTVPPQELRGLWKDGDLLVIHRESIFPEICLATNEPTPLRHRLKLRWSYPIDISYRTLRIEVGISNTRLRRNRIQKLLGILLFLFPFLLRLGPHLAGWWLLIFISAWLPAAYLIFDQPIELKIQRFRDSYFWIKGANQDFVSQLPDFPFR